MRFLSVSFERERGRKREFSNLDYRVTVKCVCTKDSVAVNMYKIGRKAESSFQKKCTEGCRKNESKVGKEHRKSKFHDIPGAQLSTSIRNSKKHKYFFGVCVCVRWQNNYVCECILSKWVSHSRTNTQTYKV